MRSTPERMTISLGRRRRRKNNQWVVSAVVSHRRGWLLSSWGHHRRRQKNRSFQTTNQLFVESAPRLQLVLEEDAAVFVAKLWGMRVPCAVFTHACPVGDATAGTPLRLQWAVAGEIKKKGECVPSSGGWMGGDASAATRDARARARTRASLF